MTLRGQSEVSQSTILSFSPSHDPPQDSSTLFVLLSTRVPVVNSSAVPHIAEHSPNCQSSQTQVTAKL